MSTWQAIILVAIVSAAIVGWRWAVAYERSFEDSE